MVDEIVELMALVIFSDYIFDLKSKFLSAVSKGQLSKVSNEFIIGESLEGIHV